MVVLGDSGMLLVSAYNWRIQVQGKIHGIRGNVNPSFPLCDNVIFHCMAFSDLHGFTSGCCGIALIHSASIIKYYHMIADTMALITSVFLGRDSGEILIKKPVVCPVVCISIVIGLTKFHGNRCIYKIGIQYYYNIIWRHSTDILNQR